MAMCLKTILASVGDLHDFAVGIDKVENIYVLYRY